jgi:chromosome segregation ATPase
MNNRVGLVGLVLVSAGLLLGLIWSQKHAADQKSQDADSISNFSNQWVQTSATLMQQREVNTSLESDLKQQKDAYQNLTNAFTEVSANLDKSEASLKAARQEVARRDAKISDLQSQNQALDDRALDLSTAITNLTSQIDETKRKLAASEGDKAFLEKELQRLITEKADLERRFNDLALLRAQVSKLKEQLNISRRLEWIRQGLFARTDRRGAEELMNKPVFVNPPTLDQHPYDLNVEVGADGSIRVVPASTNKPSAGPEAPSTPAAR